MASKVNLDLYDYQNLVSRVEGAEEDAKMYQTLMERDLSKRSKELLYVSPDVARFTDMFAGIYSTNELLHKMHRKVEIVEKSNILMLIYYKLFTNMLK
jgi:uncharacterized protein YabN with tetrapyrrole methylase and pyrophosphatase domain